MSEQRKLYRSESEKLIAGVCGGLAEYFGVDPLLVRFIFVVLALNGLGVVLYLVMWVVIPTRSMPEMVSEEIMRHNVNEMRERVRQITRSFRESSQGSMIIGLALVALGVLFIARELLPAIPSGIVWPVVLILIGAFMLLRRR